MLKNKDPENKAGDLSQSKYSGGSVSWEEKKSYGLLQPVQFPLAAVLILLLISKKQFVLSLNIPAITETKNTSMRCNDTSS